jgi:ribosomal protein S6--L-glutamate ligase
MPKAYLAATSASAKKILETINYPVIMKFPSGTQGKGVMYAESFAAANSMLDALIALKQPFIIQEYVETGGTDTRCIVVGDKVVAAMRRVAIEGEKRANIHAGGFGELVTLDKKQKKIAVESAKVVGAEICAVDILQGAKGPVVIEINLSPGLQGITKATNIDVADKIAKYLHDKSTVSSKKKAVTTNDILVDLGIEKPEKVKEIITNLDFRGERILLPEAITHISKFKEGEEVTVDVEEDKVLIKKFMAGKK